MFDKILYGGDYNPNQWGKEVWKEDMEYFRKAHINSATVNVFSWAKLQPSEEDYDFSELDEIVETLRKEGSSIVMATSTGAMPAWMVKWISRDAAMCSDTGTTPVPIRPFIRNIWRGWRQNWRSAMVRILISSAGM